MTIQTTAASLNSALRAVSPVVERHATIPILATVRFGDGKVSANNLDMQAEVLLPEVGRGNGAFCAGFHSLAALAKHTAPAEAVTLSEDDHVVTVTFNGSDYGIPSLPASDFPEFRKVDGARTLIGNAGLVDAMRRIRFAVSTEETRYYLNGVAIINDHDGKPVAVATDGYRLALTPLAYEIEGAPGRIIPRRVVDYLCARKGEPEAITFADQPYIKVEYAGLTLSAKTIDGTYPDVFRIIPADATPVFSVDRHKLIPVLRRMESVFARRERAVKLTIVDGELAMSVTHPDYGSGRERLPVECEPGIAAETGFNISYLIEALSAFRGDRVTFAVAGLASELAGNPCLMTCADDALRIVLMPMRM